MGWIHISKRHKSEINPLSEKIDAYRNHNDLITHECAVEDHGHPPLSIVKGSYGKYNRVGVVI